MNPYELTIAECQALIAACDAMERDVTDFEARFIASNLGRREFTDRQKEVIAKMIGRYEGKGLSSTWRSDFAPKKIIRPPVEDDMMGEALR